MKRQMIFVVAAIAAVAAFGENLYRTQINGGEWEYWETFADAVGNSVSKGDSTISTVVIELLKDDTTTWTSSVLFGRGSSTGGYSTRTCTLRSSTADGNTTRFMLKKAAATAAFTGNMPQGNVTINVENIIIDGGAVWTHPDDLTKTDDTGLGALTVGLIQQQTGSISSQGGNNLWKFGEDCLIRNFHMANGNSAVIYAQYTSQAVYTFASGSRIEDCRGGMVLYAQRHTPGFVLDGTVIANCASPASIVRLGNDNSSGADKAAGQRVVRDSEITGNYSGSGAAVEFNKSFTLTVGGDLVIAENVNSTGAAADLKLDATSTLAVSGGLGASASVGIVSAAHPVLGEAFATTDDPAATFAAAFFWDGSTDKDYIAGANGEDGQIVWASSTISYTAEDVEEVAYGQAYEVEVKVADLEPGEYTVTYADKEEGPYAEKQPEMKEAGDYELWFKIESSGRRTVVDHRSVSLKPAGEYFYRWRVNGGSWTYLTSLSQLATAVVGLCYTNAQTHTEIESLWDDATTLNAALEFGYSKYGETKDFTRYFRWRSSPAAGRSFVITRASSSASIHFRTHSATGNFAEWRFEDIVFDGGAKWSDKDDFRSTEQEESGIGAVGTGGFFNGENGNYRQNIVLSTNCVMRNFALADTAESGLVNYCYANSFPPTLTMEANALITDCRGGAVIYIGRSPLLFNLKGGTITRCSSGNNQAPLVFLNGNAADTDCSKHVFDGVVITNNAVYAKGAVNVPSWHHVSVQGDTIVRDNLKADGASADLVLANAEQLHLTGDSDNFRDACVGITYAASAGQKEGVFGVAEATVKPRSAQIFFDDSKPSLRGAVDASGNLCWRKLQSGLMLILR